MRDNVLLPSVISTTTTAPHPPLRPEPPRDRLPATYPPLADEDEG